MYFFDHPPHNSRKCDNVWSKVLVNQTDYIIVGVCYHSPEGDEREVNLLHECIKMASDMICRNGRLQLHSKNLSTFKMDDLGYKFKKLVLDCFSEQHVDKPTKNNNISNLILNTYK